MSTAQTRCRLCRGADEVGGEVVGCRCRLVVGSWKLEVGGSRLKIDATRALTFCVVKVVLSSCEPEVPPSRRVSYRNERSRLPSIPT